MSIAPQETPQYDRAELYRDLGLEDLLEDRPLEAPTGKFVVDEREDSFGNSLCLVWDSEREKAQLWVNGTPMATTTGERAADMFNHSYVLPQMGDLAISKANEVPEAA